jgi:hypothetical protein
LTSRTRHGDKLAQSTRPTVKDRASLSCPGTIPGRVMAVQPEPTTRRRAPRGSLELNRVPRPSWQLDKSFHMRTRAKNCERRTTVTALHRTRSDRAQNAMSAIDARSSWTPRGSIGREIGGRGDRLDVTGFPAIGLLTCPPPRARLGPLERGQPWRGT